MFDLTEEILSQIIFTMENQNRRFFVRLRDGLVLPAERLEEDAEGEGYEEPPVWTSSDGYRLMERFLVTVQHPLVREELRGILASGRGVFRQFKNTLQEWPEIQRRWFSFKRREMRSRIIAWYNALREREGLPRVAVEEATEETGELVLSDFSIRRLESFPEAELAELHRSAFFEAYGELDPEVAELLYLRRRCALADFGPRGATFFGAFDTDEALAGLLWARAVGHDAATAAPAAPETATPQGAAPQGAAPEPAPPEGAPPAAPATPETAAPAGAALAPIALLYVVQAHRGLGIDEALTSFYLSDAEHRGVKRVFLEGPWKSDPVGRHLEQSGAMRLYVGTLLELTGREPASDDEGDYPPDSYL